MAGIRHEDAAASFDPLRPKLMRAAYRMLGSVADAEDVLQVHPLDGGRPQPQAMTRILGESRYYTAWTNLGGNTGIGPMTFPCPSASGGEIELAAAHHTANGDGMQVAAHHH
jgi:hypothetical protein